MTTEHHSDTTATVREEQRPLEQVVFEALDDFGADPDRISREARLEDLEVDSLDLVELGQIIQDEYGVRLELEKFRGVDTVGDAIDAIALQLP